MAITDLPSLVHMGKCEVGQNTWHPFNIWLGDQV